MLSSWEILVTDVLCQQFLKWQINKSSYWVNLGIDFCTGGAGPICSLKWCLFSDATEQKVAKKLAGSDSTVMLGCESDCAKLALWMKGMSLLSLRDGSWSWGSESLSLHTSERVQEFKKNADWLLVVVRRNG